MSPSVTIANDGIKMPAKLRNLYQAQKPMITINLQNKRTVYTTLDRLEGTVSIVSPIDIKFDEIDIEFVGTTRTYVERVTTAAAISGRSEAFHQFLKLQQPRIEEFFPQNGVLRAGHKYDLPFLFVIPQQLLPKICQHKIVSPAVRDAHLQLPPTFGDKEAQPKTGPVDDMVPDMASIRYGIFVRITKDKEQNDEIIKTTIASHAIRLRVVPATIEQPPLDITGDNDEFNSRKEKNLKKGVLKGKLGTLAMEAAQPPSLRMFARTNDESQPSSIATIMLRFDPADSNAQPPKLGSLASKLKVCTYFASTARANYPRRCMSGVDLSQGLHTEQMNLSSRCMANAEWTKRDPAKPETLQRRDSAFSISDSDAGRIPHASAAYKGGAYYTARLLVPITLPSNRVFLPTFHSCLVSRVYLLKLELNVQSAGIGGSMDLRLPLQISCAGATGEPQRQSSIDAAMETQVDGEDTMNFFEPRTIRPPADEYIGRSRIGSQVPLDDAPPDYSFFAPAQHGSSASVPVY